MIAFGIIVGCLFGYGIGLPLDKGKIGTNTIIQCGLWSFVFVMAFGGL